MNNPKVLYPTKFGATSPQWPYGEPQDITVSGDGTGTPWVSPIVKDIMAVQQGAMVEAGIVPSGASDTADNSQILEALRSIFSTRLMTHNMATDANYTLTAAQNKYLIVEVTDTGDVLTATREIIVAGHERTIVFINATLQMLTVKTSGGSSVEVPKDGAYRLYITLGGVYRDAAENNLAANSSITNYNTASTDTTIAAPIGRSISQLVYTGATGTITLPPSSSLEPGARVWISKNNSTMGSVNINPDGTDPAIWGTAQLRLYSDGDHWLIQWDGTRWVLREGGETGSNANGLWEKYSNLKMTQWWTLGSVLNPAVGTTYTDTYPVPFFERSIVVADVRFLQSGGAYASPKHNNYSTFSGTHYTAIEWKTDSTSTNAAVAWTARGYWA